MVERILSENGSFNSIFHDSYVVWSDSSKYAVIYLSTLFFMILQLYFLLPRSLFLCFQLYFSWFIIGALGGIGLGIVIFQLYFSWFSNTDLLNSNTIDRPFNSIFHDSLTKVDCWRWEYVILSTLFFMILGESRRRYTIFSGTFNSIFHDSMIRCTCCVFFGDAFNSIFHDSSILSPCPTLVLRRTFNSIFHDSGASEQEDKERKNTAFNSIFHDS